MAVQLPRPTGTRYPFAYPLAFTGNNANGPTQLGVSGGQSTGIVISLASQRWSFVNIGFASTGPFLIQLIPTRLSGGLFYGPIDSRTLLGPLDRPGLLPMPLVLENTESMQVQLTNNNGAVANDVQLTFWGYRDLGAC